MTWQWVVLILGVLAVLVAESYINVLSARTKIAALSLGMEVPNAPEARHTNGNS